MGERTLVGEFTDLEVEGDMAVNGSVRGLRIPSGTGLVVNGAVFGDVVVRRDGALVVNGTFSPDRVHNEGTILVAGVADVARDELAGLGRFGMSPGSFLEGNLLLDRDGSLRRIVGGTLEMDDDLWRIWLADEGRFAPLGEVAIPKRPGRA